MTPRRRLLAVVVTLVGSALAALLITWICSVVLLRIGVQGLAHVVALMLVMPIAFAAVALMVARRVLLAGDRG